MRSILNIALALACLSLSACWDFGSQQLLLEPAPADELLYPAMLSMEMEDQPASLCVRQGTNDYACEGFDTSNGEIVSETMLYRIAAYELVSEQRSAYAPSHYFIVTNVEPDNPEDDDPDHFYYVGAGYVVDGETVFFALNLDDMPEQELASKEALLTAANELALERYNNLDARQLLNGEVVVRTSIEGDGEAMLYALRRKLHQRAMLDQIGQ